ncbi:gas vesicle protein GvpJ [Halobiforma nitratireducens]|uniref:Gas vesicle protein GVPa n=1 Tax=Halobiforma nitratireducens JCM 10879 TaxID=1227454 RepID=M0MB28_9EURY|nr:gas vesicle protein [Halobiforma nitratireducens]EMA41849.1 gas vesicle protein GVPa [Halobiforma nitratireducens JCM 10879]
MVDDFQPSRQKTDLAEVVEMLLDKGIVINADIAVSIGDTQLLGVQLRAAIASFETAAKYGLEFPEGTDMRRVAQAVDEPGLTEMDRPNPAIDPTRGVNATPDERDADDERREDGDRANDESESVETEDDSPFAPPDRGTDRLGARPNPERPTSGGFDLISGGEDGDESGGDGGSASEESGNEIEANPDAESETEGD